MRKDKFAYLDDEKMQLQLIHFRDEQQVHVTFYLPQMHCSSCLYLLENLHRINPGIISSKVNSGLAIPVLLYSALPFYISSWKSLKHKFLNIDAPIALAIIITFIRSAYEVINGTGGGYFDSMTGIVFFMLAGRILRGLNLGIPFISPELLQAPGASVECHP